MYIILAYFRNRIDNRKNSWADIVTDIIKQIKYLPSLKMALHNMENTNSSSNRSK